LRHRARASGLQILLRRSRWLSAFPAIFTV
jgi:hypothetical protein